MIGGRGRRSACDGRRRRSARDASGRPSTLTSNGWTSNGGPPHRTERVHRRKSRLAQRCSAKPNVDPYRACGKRIRRQRLGARRLAATCARSTPLAGSRAQRLIVGDRRRILRRGRPCGTRAFIGYASWLQACSPYGDNAETGSNAHALFVAPRATAATGRWWTAVR